MTFRCVTDEIRKAIVLGLEKVGYYDSTQEQIQKFDITEPVRKEHGDLACNVAFQLSKKYKKRPLDIANEIVEKCLKPYISERQEAGRSSSFILSVETHPSGYINFRINFAKLAETTLNSVLDDPNFGLLDLGCNKRVLIEHTSVNPNKALHIGHIRNMVIGDSLFRLMRATNHNTWVLNYIDDSGLQVADIIVGFKFGGFPVEPAVMDNGSASSKDNNEDNNKFAKFDHYCDEIYVKVNELYKTDKSLEEKRQFVLREIEKGKSEIPKFS